MRRERSGAEWRAALQAAGIELKRTGAAAWNGPCLLCGGEDRFHLTDRGEASPVVGCRRCIDGQGGPERGRQYGKLLHQLWPDDEDPAPPGLSPGDAPGSRQRPESPTPPPVTGDPPPQTDPRDADRRRIERARRLWAAAAPLEPVAADPGWAYLVVIRRCWPPAILGLEAPACVRWLAVDVTPEKLPANAAGALVWAFTDASGAVNAVQLEALAGDGTRLEEWPGIDGNPKRKTLGRFAGAWLRIPARRRDPGRRELVLVEGPGDALAAQWLWPEAAVWAAGGPVDRLDPDEVRSCSRLILAADADPAGRKAASAALERLEAAGVDVAIWHADDRDPEDRWREILAEAAPDEIPAVQWAAICDMPEPRRPSGDG